MTYATTGAPSFAARRSVRTHAPTGSRLWVVLNATRTDSMLRHASSRLIAVLDLTERKSKYLSGVSTDLLPWHEARDGLPAPTPRPSESASCPIRDNAARRCSRAAINTRSGHTSAGSATSGCRCLPARRWHLELVEQQSERQLKHGTDTRGPSLTTVSSS